MTLARLYIAGVLRVRWGTKRISPFRLWQHRCKPIQSSSQTCGQLHPNRVLRGTYVPHLARATTCNLWQTEHYRDGTTGKGQGFAVTVNSSLSNVLKRNGHGRRVKSTCWRCCQTANVGTCPRCGRRRNQTCSPSNTNVPGIGCRLLLPKPTSTKPHLTGHDGNAHVYHTALRTLNVRCPTNGHIRKHLFLFSNT